VTSEATELIGCAAMTELVSSSGVAYVERIDGKGADPSAPPRLLVEVPHGAETRAHYDALRSRLAGDLPADLHVFFHVNTDVGAWDYGRCVAERVIAADPTRSALLVRSLVPRTFVDVNRVEDAGDDLAKGGLTPGVPPYVRDPRDLALLLELHRSYVRMAERAYELVCGSGGFALTPHTYGPRTMGIERIDDSIVSALRKAHEPEEWARWPERPQIDLITSTPEGTSYAPDGMAERLIAAYRAMEIQAIANGTYTLHPATQGYRFATRYPKQVLCLEVRRDLLVEQYTPFEEMTVRKDAADRIAAPIADAIDDWLRG
jgi:predicted N-formylglutamate amidohydrolase